MAMKSERAFLASILNTVRYPLILVDREGRIEAVNHAADDLLGVSPGAICGKSVGEVAGHQGPVLNDAVTSVVASGGSQTIKLRSYSRWFGVTVEPIVA